VAGCPPTHLSRCTSRCATTSAGSARRARRGQPPDRRRYRRPLGGFGHVHAQFEALAELQQQGLIRHLGLSTVSLDELTEAQRIASTCLQNSFNIANRADEAVLAATAEQHIADVPYFPARWLPAAAVLIPCTSSAGHLAENVTGAALGRTEAPVIKASSSTGRDRVRPTVVASR